MLGIQDSLGFLILFYIFCSVSKENLWSSRTGGCLIWTQGREVIQKVR